MSIADITPMKEALKIHHVASIFQMKKFNEAKINILEGCAFLVNRSDSIYNNGRNAKRIVNPPFLNNHGIPSKIPERIARKIFLWCF